MAHFNFEKSVTDATKLDAPLRGPLMRWQRKALEAGVNRLSIADGNTTSNGPRSGRTPGKTPRTPHSGTTPTTGGRSGSKSPYRSVMNKTPNQKPTGKQSKSESNTPHQNRDRFIPNRSAMDMEVSHRLLNNAENMDPVTGEMSPRTREYRRQVKEATGQGAGESKILAFNEKPPAAKEGHINSLKVLYSGAARSTSKGPAPRHIPQQADKVLDAPELIDDYYLNLLSWSSQNLLTVALGRFVYLWNATTASITELVELENQEDYISGVSWMKEGNILAVGISNGTVQLWDVDNSKLMRTMPGHSARVGSLSWNTYILSSGSRSGAIHHHDVRVAEHHVGSLTNHQQEVCGLAWSGDGRHLASGGNDNLVNIWDANLTLEGASPLHSFTHHQAAVKAVAWCPWQATLLATGGGTADRNIRLWNVSTGSCLSSTDTNSQVSAILWSNEHKELVSGHGYSQNQLTVWKYPAMTCLANLTGHTERILSLAMSPDGTYVASAAADESIRLWKIFDVAEKKRKASSSKATKDAAKLSILTRGIR